ncbi:MAG TPA: hypothetical protein VF170_04355 [Planctomycetaceae bacterium]
MTADRSDRRWFWISIGLAAGLAISFVWPHEDAAAAVADRNDKFAMVTAEFDVTNFVEGVFVLDFLTGQLRGSVMDPRNAKFSVLYARNIAADFAVNPNEPGTYAIVAGRTNLPRVRGVSPATACIYVAELNSGKVVCYSFPTGAARAAELTPVDAFQFREAVAQ